MNNFESVVAWQKAYKFTLLAYQLANTFPECERFGLCSQFKRAAVSVPANIAEGYKKLSKADKLRFYNIAQGSIEECRCYVYLSKDLGYVDAPVFNELMGALSDASRLLNAYCKGVINNGYADDGQQGY